MPLKVVRRLAGLTLEQACDAVNEITGAEPGLNRGSLSAIESGLRGVSRKTLDAIAVAYGLEPEEISTDYTPRERAI